MKKIMLIAILIALALSGCWPVAALYAYEGITEEIRPDGEFKKDSYLDGVVVIEYFDSAKRGIESHMSFIFYDNGKFNISFSITPGEEERALRYIGSLPNDFSISILETPREQVVRGQIPGALRVTIEKDGISEWRDF